MNLAASTADADDNSFIQRIDNKRRAFSDNVGSDDDKKKDKCPIVNHETDRRKQEMISTRCQLYAHRTNLLTR